MKNLLTQKLAWLVVLVVMTLHTGSAWGQGPRWDWVVSPGVGMCSAVATDSTGNIFVAGGFSGDATYGDTTLAHDGWPVRVAKLTSTGNVIWAARAGGPLGNFYITDLAVDDAGNVYISGRFSYTVIFGRDTLAAGNNLGSLFVAKLTSNGSWAWATSINAETMPRYYPVAVDHAGNVYVSARVYSRTGSTVSFGTFTVQARDNQFIVAKLNTSGVWQWAVAPSSSSEADVYDLSVDSHNNVYVSGDFRGAPLTLGSTTLANHTNANHYTMLVAKLDSTGARQWATSVRGTSGFNQATMLRIDKADNIFVSGSGSGPTDFGSVHIARDSSTGYAFVGRMTSAGTWQWVTTADNVRTLYYHGNLGLASNGDLYVIGSLMGTLAPLPTFGAITLSYPYGLFIAKMNAAGTWQWVKQGNLTGWVSSIHNLDGLAVDGTGRAYIVGSFKQQPLTFDSLTITPTGIHFNSFIAALAADGSVTTPDTVDFSAITELTPNPNPAHETVRLMGTNAPTATLLDALGRVVRTWLLEPVVSTLDLRGLVPGIYTVRAGTAARRLVVK